MSEAMKFMSSKRQQELVDAVKDAADLHLDGSLATDAIAKVASERSFGENEARLMVEAFNTSKTLAHMRDAQGSEKAASFDLADADQVIALMFPKSEAVKTAFAVEEYSFSPRIPNYFEQEVRSALSEKVATVLIESQEGAPAKNGAEVTALSSTPSDIRYRKAYNACDYWRKKADAHRAEAAKMRGQIHEACRSIAESFRTPAGVGGWNTFAKEAEQLHGKDGRIVVDAIAEDFGLNSIMARHGAKEAAVTLPDPEAINHKLLKVAVLSIDAASDELEKEAKCREECAAAKARWFRSGGVKVAAKDKKEKDPKLPYELQSQVDALRRESAVPKAQLEQAKLRDEIVDRRVAPATNLLKSVSTGARDFSDLVGTVRSEIDRFKLPEPGPGRTDDSVYDPNVGLEADYTNAVIQLNIQDAMESDPVIAEHASSDPEMVLKAVKELAEIEPAILMKPMALKSMLRRHLELGQTELHELEQQRKVVGPRTGKGTEGV